MTAIYSTNTMGNAQSTSCAVGAACSVVSCNVQARRAMNVIYSSIDIMRIIARYASTVDLHQRCRRMSKYIRALCDEVYPLACMMDGATTSKLCYGYRQQI